MDPISCDIFSKVHCTDLEAKYCTYWNTFSEYFISTILTGPISWDFSSKVHFKYIEAKQRTLPMGEISNGSFFKLVLMFS